MRLRRRNRNHARRGIEPRVPRQFREDRSRPDTAPPLAANDPSEPVVAVAGEGSEGVATIQRLQRAQSSERPRRSREVPASIAKPPARSPSSGEETWARGRSSIGWRWLIGLPVLGLVVVAGSLAAVQALVDKRRDDGSPRVPLRGYELERIEVDDRAGFLDEDPSQLLDAAAVILTNHSATPTAEATAHIRATPRVKALAADRLQPWPSPPVAAQTQDLECALVTDREPPFMVVWGRCEDHSTFRAYFVRERGRLLLDWEASSGFCEVPIVDLPATAPTKPVLVRCLLGPRTFYTANLPEERFQCYLIEDARGQHFVWGYTERGSDLDRRLDGALSADSAFQEKQRNVRVVVSLAVPPVRDNRSQFQIIDLLQTEWVMPAQALE